MDRLLHTSQAGRAAEDNHANPIVLAEGIFIDIIATEQVGNYKLSVSFSDGVNRVIDFEPFLRSSQNPQIRAYLEPDNFARFRVEEGDLVWDDYGLCFPIADLYENRI